jgi:UDP-N-acetylmuramyl pentapeptide phosphotransferase/UDP-N-acetylglucosamine-1-phosphate transferase
MKKTGTPTMGGLTFLISIIITSILAVTNNNKIIGLELSIKIIAKIEVMMILIRKVSPPIVGTPTMGGLTFLISIIITSILAIIFIDNSNPIILLTCFFHVTLRTFFSDALPKFHPFQCRY